MIVAVEGHEKTGKSVLGLSAPLPIVTWNMDMGFDRAVFGTAYDKLFRGLRIKKHRYSSAAQVPPKVDPKDDITCFELPAPLQFDADRVTGYMAIWDYFMATFAEEVQKPGGTLFIDTGTLLTRYKRDAYLEELQGRATSPTDKVRKNLSQIEYAHPDGAIRALFTFATACQKNLVVSFHLRDQYGPGMRDGLLTSVPTGASEHDGVRDVMKLVDVQLRNVKDKSGNIQTKFVTCGPDLSWEGQSFPLLSWNGLVGMLSANWHGPSYDRRQMHGGNAMSGLPEPHKYVKCDPCPDGRGDVHCGTCGYPENFVDAHPEELK